MIHCDVELCVGCRTCEVTCSYNHFRAVSPALSRIHVIKLEEIGIDMAVACIGCVEKPCLECPTDALSAGEKGELIFEKEKCGFCDTCTGACPIGAIIMYNDQPLLCDLCDGETRCVKECPTGALSYKEDAKVSLKEFMKNEGSPNRKRSLYVLSRSNKLREEWIGGRRIDS